ncbi:MAG: T9SS type A sorting domain-containing protein [Bacteroidetes bacterium]|nr:T9SS type A sorting domain-containing protein [Bacteroidota bacterium]
MKTRAFVAIKVFNPFGIEVATLVNEEKQPGEYTVHFPVIHDKYPSGIYFLQMRCDNYLQTRKMVIQD